MAGILGYLMDDTNQMRLAGFGSMLMQMDQGQSPDTSWIKHASDMDQGRAFQNQLRDGSAAGLDKFSADERQFLLTLPPPVAQKFIAERLFAKPEPVKGVAVGGRLVNPLTGQVIYDSGPDQGAHTDGAPSGYRWIDPNDRTKGVTTLEGFSQSPPDDYGRYALEETNAGRTPLSRLDYAKAKAPSMSVETGPDGSVRLVQGIGAGSGGKETESERVSAGYQQRMTASEQVFDQLSTQGVDRIGFLQGAGVGTRAEGYVLNDQEQMLLQAQRDWVRAKLRKESGAVIGDEEMAEELRTYFPQPGEGPEVARQKRESRLRAERQMQITAGAAADKAGPITGAPPQGLRLGVVEDGYRYLGGDPASPSSWKKE